MTASESRLTELGFGYRAKYIVGSANRVHSNGGVSWLDGLRNASRDAAQSALVSLPGVGPKVADCISLFSLDHLDVVPVDTHVWQMAVKYLPGLSSKSGSSSPSPKLFGQIGDFFICKFGDKAGWAHTILFSAAISKKSASEGTSSPTSSTRAQNPTVVKKRKKVESDADNDDYVPTSSKRASKSEL